MTTAAPLDDPDGTPVRIMLAAADLLQARAVVVLDPAAGALGPERIATLAAPAGDADVDFLAPAYSRPADAGLLMTQLLRPLTRGLYGRDLREPMVPEFGASARFVAHCTQLDFDRDRGRWSTHYWIAAEALAGRFLVRQLPLGPRLMPVTRGRDDLRAVFQQVLTSAFLSIEATSDSWLRRSTVEDDPLPEAFDTGIGPNPPDATPLLSAFERDVPNLDEILHRILTPDTHLALKAAASPDSGPSLPGALWADIVGDFLLAHHHHVILRESTVQALLPLYLARTGTFLLEHAASSPADTASAAQRLCGQFEQIKPRIVDRWAQPAVR